MADSEDFIESVSDEFPENDDDESLEEDECEDWSDFFVELEKENTALGLAVQKGDYSRVQMLIQEGADVNELDGLGGTALMLAARSGNRKCLRLLIEAEAGLDIADKYHITALMAAAQSGHHTCVFELIKAGADVNVPNPLGGSALVQAIQAKNNPCVALLLEAGAHVPKDLSDPLVVLNNCICEKLLLKAGTSVNITNHSGGSEVVYTPYSKLKTGVSDLLSAALGQAMLSNNCECVNLLLRAGANVTEYHQSGMGALFSESTLCVRYSLKAGAHSNLFVQSALESHFREHKLTAMGMLVYVAGTTIVISDTELNKDVKTYLEFGEYDEELQQELKHMCRVAIRKHLMDVDSLNLFHRVASLPLPSILTKYLIYNVSLKDWGIDEESKRDIECAIRYNVNRERNSELPEMFRHLHI